MSMKYTTKVKNITTTRTIIVSPITCERVGQETLDHSAFTPLK